MLLAECDLCCGVQWVGCVDTGAKIAEARSPERRGRSDLTWAAMSAECYGCPFVVMGVRLSASFGRVCILFRGVKPVGGFKRYRLYELERSAL